MKTLLLEPDMRLYSHAVFNAAMLACCSSLDEVTSLTYAAQDAQSHQVQALLEATGFHSQVRFRPDPTLSRAPLPSGDQASMLLKAALQQRKLFRDYLTSASDPVDLLLLTSANRASLLGLRLLSAKGRGRCVAVMHDWQMYGTGEFGTSRKRKMAAKFISFCAGGLGGTIVLSESARKSLLAEAPKLSSKVLAIDHPALMYPVKARSPEPPPLRIGFLGNPQLDRGIQEFLELAKAFEGERRLKFVLVGTVNKHVPRDRTEVEYVEGKLTYEQYFDRLASVHVSVSLLHAPSYLTRASNAVIESLSLGVPVIATKNPYTDQFAAKGLKSITFTSGVSQTEEVLRSYIDSLHTFDGQARFDEAICDRRAFAPEAVAPQLRPLIM